MSTYNKSFYASYQDGSCAAGEAILRELFSVLHPASIIDVGCGIGTWLSAAKKLGVTKVTGVDGDYVDRRQLLIAPEEFQSRDLSRELKTEDLGRYDMAMSVEVGEHLPEAIADSFVAALTSLSDVVFFSAAIPGQGGTAHINEQWPAWWCAKFAACGFVAVDIVRPRLWEQGNIAYYYLQNGLLYIKESAVAKYPGLEAHVLPPGHWTMRMVHPRKWEETVDPRNATLRFVLQALPGAFARAVKRRVARLFGKGF